MTKIRNMVKDFTSQSEAQALAAEYRYIGREARVEPDGNAYKLTVYALPLKYKKKSEQEAKLQAKREGGRGYEDDLY